MFRIKLKPLVTLLRRYRGYDINYHHLIYHNTQISKSRNFSKCSVSYNKSSTNSFISSLPQKVVEFMKNESKHLVHSLGKDDVPEFLGKDKYQDLDPNIISSLEGLLDEYNRFLKLLSFNPVDIPPSLYIHFLNKKEFPIDENTRNLLVSRLTFHGLYSQIWERFVDESSTIHDVEELAICIGRVLEENNHLRIGFLQAIITAEDHIPNQSLKNVLIDSISHNFDLPKDLLLNAAKTYNELPIVYASLQKSDIYELLLFARMFGRDKSGSVTQLKYLESLSEQLNGYEGWLSFILESGSIQSSQKDFIINFIRDLQEPLLNDYDFAKLISIKVAPSSTIYDLFKNFFSMKVSSSWSLYLLVQQILEEGDVSLLATIILDYHHLLNNKILVQSMNLLYEKDETLFLASLNTLVSSKNVYKYEAVIESIFWSHDHSKIKLKVLHQALLATNKSSKFQLTLRKQLYIEKEERDEVVDIYDHFITDSIWPRKVLLELFRSLVVRNNVLEEKLINSFLRAFVLKYTHLNESGLRVLDDTYRINLNKAIRALAQAITDLETTNIKVVLEIIYKELLNGESFDTVSDSFKAHFFKSLSFETFNFLDRASNNSQDIPKFVLSLDIDNRIKQYAWYHYKTKSDATLCLLLAEANQHSKSKLTRNIVNAVESGILASNQNLTSKLNLYKKFRELLIQYGFKSKMNIRNFVSLMEVVMKTHNSSDFEDLLSKIIAFSQRQKVPQHVTNKLIRKGKVIEKARKGRH